MLRLSERLLNRMPFVRGIYGMTKQIVETVAGNKGAFREVVLVEFQYRGIWTIGFITGRMIDEIVKVGGQPMINVLVLATPNPTSGFLLFCRRRTSTSCR